MTAIASIPLLVKIRRLYDERGTGLLALANGDGERIDIFFREGMIEAVSSNQAELRLGNYLSKDAPQIAQDLDAVQAVAQRQQVSFGEAAVRRKLVDHIQVSAAARAQAVDLLGYAIAHAFSVDSFNGVLRSYYAPARIGFPYIMLELARGAAEPSRADTADRIVLSSEFDLSAFPWSPEEVCVLCALQEPIAFADLLTATGLDAPVLARILDVFDRLGTVSVLTPMELQRREVSSTAVVQKVNFDFEKLVPVVTNALLDEKLEVARNESSFASEQFRNLKVQLSDSNLETPLKVFTVSSPDPQDGKSLVSANLAFSFSRDPGRRVAIIDCDLRSPSLEKYLGVPSEPGLLQYLVNGRLDPHCYMRRVENLYFLTAGGTAPNPIEVLSMRKMKELIERLRSDFDAIILDAPPYSPIADARVVTGLSDGLIMVVRRGKTTYSSSDRAFKSVDRKKLLGVVFNDVKPMLLHTYHNSGYYRYGSDRRLYSGDEKNGKSPKSYLKA